MTFINDTIDDIKFYFDGCGTKDSDPADSGFLSLWSLCGDVTGLITSPTFEGSGEAVAQQEPVSSAESKSQEDETPIKETESETEESSTNALEESPIEDTEDPRKPSILGRIKRSFRTKPSKSKDEAVEESTAEREVNAPEEEVKLSKPSILNKVKRSFRAAKAPASPASDATDDVAAAMDVPQKPEDAEPKEIATLGSTNEAIEKEPTNEEEFLVEEDTIIEEKCTFEEVAEVTTDQDKEETEELVEAVENEADVVKDEAKLPKPSLLSKVKRSFVKKAASRTDEEVPLDESCDVREDPAIETEGNPEETTEETDSDPTSPPAPVNAVHESTPVETEETNVPKGITSFSVEEDVLVVSESIPTETLLATE